jgi:transposase InsO family protein
MIRVGDTVQTESGKCRIVGYSGSQLKLYDEGNHVYEIIDVASLPLILTEPSQSAENSPRVIDLVDHAVRLEAIRKEVHVREVLNGTPQPGRDGDPAYAPKMTNLSDRKLRKARELGVSESTIDNWLSRYKKGGASALVDRRSTRRRGGIHASDEMIMALRAVIKAETKRPTRTFGALYDELAQQCRSRGILAELKSETTVRRQLQQLAAGKYTLGAAVTRRTAANVPDRMFASRPAYVPGGEIQIDSSPGDFMALDYMGHRTRLRLTAMIDKATRSIPAVGASMISAKGTDHAMLLARALVPQQNRPHPEVAAQVLDRIEAPWLSHLTQAGLRKAFGSRPFIRIQRIMLDNGRDYLSEVFYAACEKFGISVTEAATYSPDDKGMIERFWKTVRTGFSQYVPGYVGNTVANRGKEVPDSELLRIDELIALFDIWITVVYQNRVHAGLIDPLDPQAPQTPNSILMAFQDVAEPIPMALTRDDYIDILPIENRTIQNDGIQLGYGKYDSPQITRLRRLPSLEGRNSANWPVRWDPYDARSVWIRDPESNDWIECALQNGLRTEQPYAVRIRRESKRIAQEQGFIEDVEARHLTESIVAAGTSFSREREVEEQRRAFALAERAAVGIPDLHEASQPVVERQVHRTIQTIAGAGRRLFDPDAD